MIVTLDESLFQPDGADDVALVRVMCEGLGRYKVQTRPAYRAVGTGAVQAWLAQQSIRIRERAQVALEDGLKAPVYVLPQAAREPRVIVERREAPEWPDTFDVAEARLPIAAAVELLGRPLRLLLENGRNDWAFLAKVVPATWKRKWDLAVERRWLEEHNAGGIVEMRRIIEVQLADDPVRRLRTWAMFDSDGRHVGDVSKQALEAGDACVMWGITYHRLQRRAIENYIPKETLADWAWRRHPKAFRTEKVAAWRAYCALVTDAERHHLDMKAEFHGQLAQHVWSDGETDDDGYPIVYFIEEAAIDRDGFGRKPGQAAPGQLAERDELFQSMFSRL